jgi:hypothetical protein
VRIEAYIDGDARAEVVDAATGKRPRRILVKDLHESPVTANGMRRRSGYVLEPGLPPRGAADIFDGPVARDIVLTGAGSEQAALERLLRRFYAHYMEWAADIVDAPVPPATAGPLTDGERRLQDAAGELRREASDVRESE